MTSKSLALAFIIYGLFLAALLARNGGLLALAVPFLVYLILGALKAPASARLTASRSIERISASGGEPVEMTILVENHGDDLANLFVSDAVPGSVHILDGHAEQRLALRDGESAKLRYHFSAERGEHHWNEVRARARDPFGLFELRLALPAPGELLIRPGTIKFRRFSLKPEFTLNTTGTIPARRAGSGCDFFGVREYRPGDSLKRINWRMAARSPRRLFTNEYEREEAADFGLILDARRLTDADTEEEALFESSVSAAASLAEAFIKQGNRLALLVFGEAMQCVYPGYGKKQLNLVMHGLARAELGRNFPIDYLKYMPARLFPGGSILVMFSPLGQHDLEAYARLRAWSHEVLLVSPDPVSYAGAKLSSPSRVDHFALRAARLERGVQLKQLARLGVKVIDWQVDQPLESIIRSATRSLAHRINV